jgi:heme-degrading monooxygenase HmoA
MSEDSTDECYTSVIEFRIHPGREADFVRAFYASGMLDRPHAIDGFGGGRLLQERENPMHFTVIATWRTPQAYAEWGEKSQIGADKQALLMLQECVAELIPGRLFGAA